MAAPGNRHAQSRMLEGVDSNPIICDLRVSSRHDLQIIALNTAKAVVADGRVIHATIAAVMMRPVKPGVGVLPRPQVVNPVVADRPLSPGNQQPTLPGVANLAIDPCVIVGGIPGA